MCVPCAKEIINNQNEQAANLASVLREMIERFPPGQQKPAESRAVDDAMYALAECEVEHILAVWQKTVEHLESIGVPPRWLALVKKVLPVAASDLPDSPAAV